jgi:hypothetical protein
MASEFDELSVSEKSFVDEGESAIDSEESDYDPSGGADIKNVHQVITEDRRKQLVALINDHGLTIAKASRKVGLMYSTAKTIYAKYRRENQQNDKDSADESKVQKGKPKSVMKKKTAQKEKSEKPRKNKHRDENSHSLKVEENDRVEAPRTRKKVKTETDKSKENFVCRIKDLSGDGPLGLKTSPSTSMVKVCEGETKFEHQAENLLAISRSKQSTDHSIAGSVTNSDYKSQMEAMMMDNLNKQKLLSQIAMSKALLSAPLLNMSQNPYNPAMMAPQTYENMLMMNYLWRHPYFSAGMKQAP